MTTSTLSIPSAPTVAVTAGEIYENPVTGERCLVLETGADHAGHDRLVVLLTVSPGGGVAGEHRHAYVRERFAVLEGRLGVSIEGAARIGHAGDEFTIPVGARHAWWNAGPKEANVLVEVTPPGRFAEVILTLFALARAGRTDAKGIPGLLQLALTAREFRPEICFTRPPRTVQRILFGAVAPLARARGLRPSVGYGDVQSVNTASPEFQRLRDDALRIWPGARAGRWGG